MSTLQKTLTAGLMHGLKVQDDFRKTCDLVIELTDRSFTENAREVRLNYALTKGYIPFLFPMSALTKEIEFKGETFVPIGRIYKKYKYTISEKTIELILENEDLFICPYGIIEWLIEHHFNVFGISPEEFIEVNETNNPYR